MTDASSNFLKENPENGDFNQYWYSSFTLDRFVEELKAQASKSKAEPSSNGEEYRIALLSAPSVYYALPDKLRQRAYFFDIDKKWSQDRGFVYFDYRTPEEFPSELSKTFDMVLVDPPFITEEVWEKYATTVKLLLRHAPTPSADGGPEGKVILTTVAENEALLGRLLGASLRAFQPSIPNLVYQYNVFTNYTTEVLDQRNPEIPE